MKTTMGRMIPISFALLTLLLVTGVVMTSCKDTEATHVAGLLESCKIKLDASAWTDAIDVCSEVDTDEGKHLTALAYMGRSGLTMANLLVEMSNSSSTPTSLIFSNIPDTDAKASDFKKALNLIMGEMETKDQTNYMEGILLSSLLIFKELKELLGLSVVDGEIGTCAGSPADITKCDFAPYLEVVSNTPKKMVFNGLGTDFYNGFCSDVTADTTADAAIATVQTDTVSVTTFTVSGGSYPDATYDVTHDVKIYGASIGKKSALYYNRVASEAYALVGTEDLSSLNFYGKMDNGINFSIEDSSLPGVSFSFCKSGVIEPPDASDDTLNDCEMLNFLKTPGL